MICLTNGKLAKLSLTLLSWILIGFSWANCAGAKVEDTQPNLIERSQALSDFAFVSWTVDLKNENVTFEVTAKTKGFIGFGISPKGGMKGADIVIGGVDNEGKPYFTVKRMKSN